MSTTPSFRARLDARIAASNSLVCVGLDPVADKLPEGFGRSTDDVVAFCTALVAATHEYAAAYKPNLAFYMALGLDGLDALKRVIDAIPDDIPVILDGKMNDMGETARAYARAVFDVLDVDALTVAPYLGEDGLEPYLAREGRGVIVLVKTSNPGSGDLQDLELTSGDPLYLHVAGRCREWHEAYPADVGMVVGATYPDQLAAVRQRCPDQIILLPGLGAQGGDTAASVRAGIDANGAGLLCSASRSIMYADSGTGFAKAAANAARDLRDEINAYRNA